MKRLHHYILLLGISLLLNNALHAAHIVGGEMYYDCLGNNDYRFTMKVYRDGNPQGPNAATSFDAPAFIAIYRGNEQFPFRVLEIQPNSPTGILVPNTFDEPCVSPPTGIQVYEATYTFVANLPIDPVGYTVVYQRCCRNATINNIFTPNDVGATFTITLTNRALQMCNSSPRFRYFPPIFVCNSIPLDFDHSATDPNGNQITYSFCSPLVGGGPIIQAPGSTSFGGVVPNPPAPPPYGTVNYIPPFTGTAPMAGNPVININPVTGLITGRPQALGQYVVGVCAEEYDTQGNLLSVLRRDFQFNVVNCVVNVFADIQSSIVTDAQELLLRNCGDSTTITFVNASGIPQNIFGYEWQFDLGAGAPFITNAANPTVTFPGYGSYSALLIVNPDSVGCSDSAEVIIELFPELTADFDFTLPAPCVNDSIPFVDLSFADGGAPIVAWDWDFDDNSSDTLQNPTHLFLSADTFNISLTVTDSNGCVDDTVRQIVWFPAAEIVVNFPSGNACEPYTHTFTNTSYPINGYTLDWDLGDGTISNAISPTNTYNAGTYPVSLTITSPTGCISNENFGQIYVRPVPFADFDFSPDNPTSFSPEVQFTNLSNNASTYNWDFGNGDRSTRLNPIYVFPDTGIQYVTLVVFHAEGCSDTIVKPVDVEPQYTYFLPNALTPNYDGVNDEFMGVGFFENINQFEMRIFNRWGQKIFETNNPNEAWNGKENNVGQDLPAGVYVFQVRIEGPRNKDMFLRGFVTVVR